MIKTITITNHLGESIELILTRPEKSGFVIKSITGLGPTTADINTVDLAGLDGAYFNSSRLQSRNIVLSLQFLSSGNGESIETIRQKSYRFFPIKKKIRIDIETDTRKVYTEGYVESNEPDIFSETEGCDVSVICPSSYFTGEKKVVPFSFVRSEFEFPFSNESISDKLIKFGEIENRTDYPVIYEGESEVGVMLKIKALGPATGIKIYNLSTKETMSIDTTKLESMVGSGIDIGDEIIINTVRGNKFIYLYRKGAYLNILNCLDKNSKWFQLISGENVFVYTADTGKGNLQAEVSYNVLYEGV